MEGGLSSHKCPPGWLEGSLRYLELYSEVMKRGPWDRERGVGHGARPGAAGALVALGIGSEQPRVLRPEP